MKKLTGHAEELGLSLREQRWWWQEEGADWGDESRIEKGKTRNQADLFRDR